MQLCSVTSWAWMMDVKGQDLTWHVVTIVPDTKSMHPRPHPFGRVYFTDLFRTHWLHRLVPTIPTGPLGLSWLDSNHSWNPGRTGLTGLRHGLAFRIMWSSHDDAHQCHCTTYCRPSSWQTWDWGPNLFFLQLFLSCGMLILFWLLHSVCMCPCALLHPISFTPMWTAT